MESAKNFSRKLLNTAGSVKGKTETSVSTAVISLTAFLLSRICILNELSPFSLPFLMVHKGNIFVFIASILGVISNPALNPYKYGLVIFSAVILSILMKSAFPKASAHKTNPLVIFITKIIFNLIFVIFREYTPFDIILCVFDAFISAVFYYILSVSSNIFKNFKSKKFYTDEETAATLILFALALAGVGTTSFPYGIRISNLIGVYLVFIISAGTNLGFTSQASTLIGLSVGLTSDNTGIYIATYALCGLLSSALKKYGKLAIVLGFVMGNIIIGIFISEESYMVISFLEIAIAGILSIITPHKKLGVIFGNLINSSTEYDKANTIREIAATKLDKLSCAFQNLSDTVNVTMDDKMENTNAINSIFDDTTDKFCKYCFLRSNCWNTDYDKTANIFLNTVEKIDKTGTVSVNDLPDFFTKRCEKAEKIINNLKNLYEIYRLNEAWQYKIYERSNIFKEQFYDLSVIIDKTKEEIAGNPYFDNALSCEIASEIEKNGIEVMNISTIKDSEDNTEVELCIQPCNGKDKCYGYIASTLEEIFDVPFEKVSGHCGAKECRLYFKESEIYRLKNSVKQVSKNTGERCGDAYTIRTLSGGSHFIALCDGSGSGTNAFNYAKSTIKLLEDFLKTGFSKRSVLNLINATLLLGPDQDYFSTVDLFVVNLKNLNAEFVKKGASATYILRESGEYDIIKGNTLPIGISQKGKEQVRKMRLNSGDIIVMASDGVVEAIDKEDWIIDAVEASNMYDTDGIAELIIKIAQSAVGENKDDMTVIVSKICPSD